MGVFLLLPLLFFNFPSPISAGPLSGVCISPGGRFPSFSSEGKPPRKASKGPKDLAACRIFRQSTCCDVTQTYPVLLLIRRLASTGEASQDCLDLWELLECSICDPRVGVRPGPPLICASLCDKVLHACADAYFSIDPISQVLSPCGLNDILCGKGSDWASNGTELCHLAGFAVQQDVISYKNSDEPFCYGGQTSLDSIADSWKSSQFGSSKSENFHILEDFQLWMMDMPIGERISWAVGGMVLTAGILFLRQRNAPRVGSHDLIRSSPGEQGNAANTASNKCGMTIELSKRKSYIRRQKQAALQRAARRLEARMSQQSSNGRR